MMTVGFSSRATSAGSQSLRHQPHEGVSTFQVGFVCLKFFFNCLKLFLVKNNLIILTSLNLRVGSSESMESYVGAVVQCVACSARNWEVDQVSEVFCPAAAHCEISSSKVFASTCSGRHSLSSLHGRLSGEYQLRLWLWRERRLCRLAGKTV